MNNLMAILSQNITRAQSLTVQFLCSLANSPLRFLSRLLRKGHRRVTRWCIPPSFSAALIVFSWTSRWKSGLSWIRETMWVYLFVLMYRTNWRISRKDNFLGHPLQGLSMHASSMGIDVVHSRLWYADDIGNFAERNCSSGTKAQHLASIYRRPFMSLPHPLYVPVLRECVNVVGCIELRRSWVDVAPWLWSCPNTFCRSL